MKILALNSSWFLRYCYLEIWAKYLIGTKMCHFEFTFSLITSGLKDLSSWNLVQVCFLAREVQQLHLEYTKTNQCLVILHSCYAWPEVGLEMHVALQLFKKKIFIRNYRHFAKIGAGFSFRSFKIKFQT